MRLRWLPTAAATTLALGLTVGVSWLLFGGTTAARGPLAVLAGSWPLIYGAQMVLAAMAGWVLAGVVVPGTPGRMVALIGAGWVGEWAVLYVAGTVLANELTPNVTWLFWLIATGGPLQPLAAIAGAWVASRAPRRS